MLRHALKTTRFSAPRAMTKLAPRAMSVPMIQQPSRNMSDEAAEAPSPARWGPTIEVIISKIFPAGFGWQAASVVAGNQGFEADSLNFALTTGAGDFAGVLAGHSTFSILNAMVGRGGGLGGDLVAGLWLATAAFCSGTAWQPTVNFLHDQAHCNFATTAVGCGAVTGFCFFVGLRLGRIIYAPLGLPSMDYANLCGDAMLSVSIGAATGTFVGTDITFPDNVLRPAFGVEDSMSDIEGMVRAGASTSAGFLCMQSVQNIVRVTLHLSRPRFFPSSVPFLLTLLFAPLLSPQVMPKGGNWLDPVKIG